MNGHTEALYAAVTAVRPVDPAVPGDGLRWLRDLRNAGLCVLGDPVWYDDLAAGEIVRLRDGARFPIDQVTPLCVQGQPVDLDAVDRWVEGQPELTESQIRARAFGRQTYRRRR